MNYVLTIASTILAVLLAVFFLALGTAKILAVAPMRELATESGFSTMAYRGIGVLEVAGAAGLLIGLVAPLLGSLAGVGLLVLLTGAIATHLRKGDGLPKFAPAAGSWLFVAAYLAVHLGTAG
jgi:hypothetical protein